MSDDIFAKLGAEPPAPYEGEELVSEQRRFVPGSELRASLPPEPDGVLGAYLVRKGLTLLGGKPKVGKSTLALGTAEAIGSHADSFLGQPVHGGPVLYVSEETGSTLLHKLPAGDVRFLTRDLAWPPPSWEELIEITAAEVQAVGAVAVVIDTLAHWAGFGPDKEKDAGAMQAALRHAQTLAQVGPAVLLAAHLRKGGGEDGEALRGSSALVGAADIVLELERVKNKPRQRALNALSRYPSTPGSLLIEHDPTTGSWQAIAEGERGDARSIGDRQAILTGLSDGERLARAELEEAVGAPERQWHGVLDKLIEDGVVGRSGEGKRGDPYRFALLRKDSAQASAQKRAVSVPAAASVSSALPVGEQQKQAVAAASANGAHCAETPEELQARLRWLTELAPTEAEREWQRLEGEWG